MSVPVDAPIFAAELSSYSPGTSVPRLKLKKIYFKSVYKPSGPSGQCLTLTFIA